MKRLTRIIIAATLLTLLPATAWCAVIKGTVRDLATGEPLAGATISVSGTNLAAFTDENGLFQIDKP